MPGPIISRKEWGAEAPDGDGTTVKGPANEVWLHHSVTQAPPDSATFEQDRAAVRLLEQIGQARFGAGISYTFVIPRSGRIFQGHSLTKRGTHTGGRNSTSRAICLIGNYEVLSPTKAQINSIRWLLLHGYREGWWKAPKLNGGHRDVKATSCPGIHAYQRIAAMNELWVEGPPATPLPTDGEPLMDIELHFYDTNKDGSVSPNEDGLTFRASVPAECGSNSAVIARAWVRTSVHWGAATFRIVAWDGVKPIAESDPKKDWWELPPNTRSFTIEGTRVSPETEVGACLLVKVK